MQFISLLPKFQSQTIIRLNNLSYKLLPKEVSCNTIFRETRLEFMN